MSSQNLSSLDLNMNLLTPTTNSCISSTISSTNSDYKGGQRGDSGNCNRLAPVPTKKDGMRMMGHNLSDYFSREDKGKVLLSSSWEKYSQETLTRNNESGKDEHGNGNNVDDTKGGKANHGALTYHSPCDNKHSKRNVSPEDTTQMLQEIESLREEMHMISTRNSIFMDTMTILGADF